MHDDLQLGAREKVVQQMTRDGLVETNLARKKKQRISSRSADDGFELKGDRTSQAAPEKASSATSRQKKRYVQKLRNAELESVREETPHAEQVSSGHNYEESPQSTDETLLPESSEAEDFEELADNGIERTGDSSASQVVRPRLSEKSKRTESQTSHLSREDTPVDLEAQTRKQKKNRVYQEESKKKTSRLRFDDEVSSSKTGKTVRPKNAESAVKEASVAASVSVENAAHKKVSETEQDNVGVQAAHQTELAAENTTRVVNNRFRETKTRSGNAKPRDKNARLEYEAEKPASKLYFEPSATETQEVQKANLPKTQQKRRIKRQYAESFKAATAGTEAAAVSSVPRQSVISRVGTGIKRFAKDNKGLVAVLGMAAVFVLMFIGAFGTFGSMFSQMEGAVIESTYLADDHDIRKAEKAYVEMENELQQQIEQIKRENPDYDEYRFQIDEISHNPYQLISYLTVKYGDFSYSQVKRELEEIFREQYHLSTASDTYTETVTRTVRVGESLGRVVTSGYCNCPICCGVWSGGPTASGVYPTSNHTIAVDAYNPFVPLGTHIIMNGTEYVVEDTGNFNQYGVQFDVYYDSHAAASAHGHQSWEAFIADSNGSNTVQVTQTTTVKRLSVTVTNSNLDLVLRNRMTEDETKRYMIYNATYGNRDYLFSIETLPAYGGMSYDIPPEALSDSRFAAMIHEAEKYLGYPYVWGGSSPETSFDCSGFVSWVVNHCGNGWDYGRLTAEGLRNVCTYVSPSEAKPGDLVFFQGTYDTAGASHCAIYVGNGMMIHCGNPIQYTSMQSAYWQQHFYCFGRLP